ncbi:hypothetical protein ACL2XP_04980 [Sodalis sp. RH21]|uniref:hypothetical protein n=1 Tax=unclassified Sodalis (in: enterobacteria) TaxID=2636512 RepID=UPI0039B5873E
MAPSANNLPSLAALLRAQYQKPMSLTAFGLALSGILREYGCALIKHKSKNDIQTNLELSDDSAADWLPQCNAV